MNVSSDKVTGLNRIGDGGRFPSNPTSPDAPIPLQHTVTELHDSVVTQSRRLSNHRLVAPITLHRNGTTIVPNARQSLSLSSRANGNTILRRRCNANCSYVLRSTPTPFPFRDHPLLLVSRSKKRWTIQQPFSV